MSDNLFASRLKTAMEQQGLRQADLVHLAEQEGIKLGKSHVSQYVSGKTIPRSPVMHFLARTLQVSASWLETGHEEQKESEAPNAPSGAEAASDAPAPSNLKTSSSSQAFNNSQAAASNKASNNQTSAPNNNQALETATNSPAPTTESRSTTMREFTKASKLDNVLYDVRGPALDEAQRMERSGAHILKLNIGNPAPFGFRAPDEVVYDMASQLADCEGYSDSKGLFSARKAIMQYAQLKNIPNVTMDDIYTANGASELISLSMSALLDNGDEILIPAPDYPLWTATATLAGGKPVHYICDEASDWYPDMQDIRSKITDKTKAIVIINPNNPTGALYPRQVLQEIVDIAREHQLIIFSDEIYDRLVMDGHEHISIASLAPDLFCVTFSGLSKSHMIAGYRIGWMILSGNKRIAKDYIEGLNMLSNMRLCSNVPAQSIVQTALGGYQSVNNYIVPGGRVYEQREFVYNRLKDIPGISVVKPKAAFYIFPKLDVKKFNITDDERFALDLLHDKKILITKGTGFNWNEPDHFRIVYLPRMEVLSQAMDDLEDFLSYYHQ